VIDLSAWPHFALLLVRPSLVVATAPPFGAIYTSARVKVGLSMILAFLLMPVVPMPRGLLAADLTAVVAREAIIGLALGMSVRLLLAGVELAGHLSAAQLGFSYAATVDPQSGARNNVLGAFFGSLAMLVFLLVNGHHRIVRGLAESYTALPMGFGHVDPQLASVVARMLGVVFVVGVQLAAPVVIVLLVVELALGLLSRAAPSLNLMASGFAIRSLVGLAVLSLTLSVIPGVVRGAIPTVMELAARLASLFR
jgi:flagellar biosynthetic protein FliR